MAIEVIGIDETGYYKAICPGCAAILRYTLSDVREYTKKDYVGDPTTIRYIPCPKCNRRLYKGLAT